MNLFSRSLPNRSLRFAAVAVSLLVAPAMLKAQTQVDPPLQHKMDPAKQKSGTAPNPGSTAAGPDRSSAYYHYGLAHLYEEMAVNSGRPDYATQAIEEYKLALNSDPNSVLLQDGLAQLYFRLGRVQDAVSAAKEQVKRNPDDVDAHTLLGQVYVRTLSDIQGPQSQQTLTDAIAEYETIVKLKPADIEPKLLLGELYAANHQSDKAEAEFKEAQKIDSNSEEVVLSMAKLYSDEGDLQRAAAVLSGVPPAGRPLRLREEYACWGRATTG